jgi:hypothetical protein
MVMCDHHPWATTMQQRSTGTEPQEQPRIAAFFNRGQFATSQIRNTRSKAMSQSRNVNAPTPDPRPLNPDSCH